MLFHKMKDETEEKGSSISTKISISLMGVLIPSLVILVLVSCFMASNSIEGLNKDLLETQTDYAVSIVDSFFESKLIAVSMFEEDTSMQAYLSAVNTREDIDAYVGKDEIVRQLAATLKQMSSENVQQVWVADQRSDMYLLSTGEIVKVGFEDTTWDEDIITNKRAIVTEPFEDPATGEQVVCIISPVFDNSKTNVLGFVGFDVFVKNLSKSLSTIKVGEQGYLELVSNSAEYIYSEDENAMGKSVSSLDISDIYKNNVINDYEGIMDFSYDGMDYTANSRICDSTQWLAIATLPMSEVNATRNQLMVIMILLSVVILALLVLMIIWMIRRTMRPLLEVNSSMEAFAQGDFNVVIQVQSNDEIGRMADSVRSTIERLKAIVKDISHVLAEISVGNLDLKVEGDYAGDLTPIREALEHIIQSLNSTMGQIGLASDQVSAGAEQVSSGAQTLSQGATEQASSIEELAATITEISGQINETAQNAAHASDSMNRVGDEAEESKRRMQEMLRAIGDIKGSADEISKIIKTIEDIAFQTNILALNAAVEAARAGAAGKGFAVVADEVRNLATKSQEASKSTAVLIENALQAVTNGTSIADETAQSLVAVVDGVAGVRETIDLISGASNEQAIAIAQVTQGIDQVSAVVQTNSATAEESAAASEELSGQAQVLKELVGQFNLSKRTEG